MEVAAEKEREGWRGGSGPGKDLMDGLVSIEDESMMETVPLEEQNALLEENSLFRKGNSIREEAEVIRIDG